MTNVPDHEVDHALFNTKSLPKASDQLTPPLLQQPYPMSDVAENVLLEKFSSSGRTGRRNALPDVMDKKYVGTSVANLPGQLDQLHLQIPSSEKLEKPNDTKDDKPTSPCASEKTPCTSEKTEKDKATKSNVS